MLKHNTNFKIVQKLELSKSRVYTNVFEDQDRKHMFVKTAFISLKRTFLAI